MANSSNKKRSLDPVVVVERIPLVHLPAGVSRGDHGSSSPAVKKVLRLLAVLALMVLGWLAFYTEEKEHLVESSTTLKNETKRKDDNSIMVDYGDDEQTETTKDRLDGSSATYSFSDFDNIASVLETDSYTTPEEEDSSSSKTDDPFDYLNQHEVIPMLNLPRSDSQFLHDNFQQAKQELHARLRDEYGSETANTMFLSRNISFHSPLGRSRDRMVRKLQRKLLEVQLRHDSHQLQRREQQEIASDPPKAKQPHKNHDTSSSSSSSSSLLSPTFIWATGGHSAAAGHGNYFNESYTARLEQLAVPIFRSIGLHFVGRNYAMGGTSSGLEVGVCIDQIFGLDIDVLSWDYSMTDGNGVGIFETYFSHAAIHPNRPSMIALNAGGRRGPDRMAVMQHMEEHGMPIMYLDEDAVVKPVTDAIPESFGVPQEDLERMGPLVRNMKCEAQVEVGDPFCGSERWSPMCPERKYKAKWHPGWKYQAMYGTLMALSLFDLLEASLKGLVTQDSYEPSALMSELKAGENNDYQLFRNSDVTTEARSNVLGDPAIDMTLVARSRPLCRTGRLPAQSRYLGIMTESSDKVSYTDYPTGLLADKAKLEPSPDGQMRLVYEEPHDARNCAVPLNQDFKDYYLVTPKDGWQSLLVPNDRELENYGNDGDEPRKGLIMIALASCGWHCPTGDLREDAFASGAIEMEVNRLKVTNITAAWGGIFLKHGNDGANTYFPANRQGRYEILARVSREGSFLRISALSIW